MIATGRRPLRLAHAADIHLDTDHQGGEHNLGLRDYCRAVFRDLLDRIESAQPDLFLLPGDLFDSNRASADTVAWAAEQLASLPFPTVLIPGNHDCLEEGSVFSRLDVARIPKLVFLGAPEGERRLLPHLDVALWGRGMVSHHPLFEPLAGLPPPLPGRWNLALAHGIFTLEQGPGFRSSPIRPGQIAASGFDYVALGHHHLRLDVSQPGTPAWFAGSPLPVTQGRKGTFLLAELNLGHPARVTVCELE